MTSAILQHRRDTAANWTTNNPVLEAGQMGYETDTLKHKFGNGSTAWNSLAYAGAGTALLAANNLSDVASAATSRTNLGLGTLATQSGTFSGTSSGTNTGDQTISLTGDVTGSGTGSFAATIATGAVGTSKLGGDVTAAGKALLDDADASAQRTTLGLGTLATQSGTFSGTSSGTNTGDQTITLTGDVTGSGTGSFAATIANDAVTYAKLQNVSATDRLLGRSTSGAGDVEEIACTAAGRALLDDANAAAQRTTLGLGTMATQNANGVAITAGTISGVTISASTVDIQALVIDYVEFEFTTKASSGQFEFDPAVIPIKLNDRVEIWDDPTAVVTSGESEDRLECEQIIARGIGLNSTTVRVFWTSSGGPIYGWRRFAYRITPI